VHKPKDRPDDPLTTREREVVWLFAEGHTADTIAARLSLSAVDVDAERTNAMRKLALNSDTELVRYVLQQSVRGAES